MDVQAEINNKYSNGKMVLESSSSTYYIEYLNQIAISKKTMSKSPEIKSAKKQIKSGTGQVEIRGICLIHWEAEYDSVYIITYNLYLLNNTVQGVYYGMTN